MLASGCKTLASGTLRGRRLGTTRARKGLGGTPSRRYNQESRRNELTGARDGTARGLPTANISRRRDMLLLDVDEEEGAGNQPQRQHGPGADRN